jgi:hypothetical protein
MDPLSQQRKYEYVLSIPEPRVIVSSTFHSVSALRHEQTLLFRAAGFPVIHLCLPRHYPGQHSSSDATIHYKHLWGIPKAQAALPTAVANMKICAELWKRRYGTLRPISGVNRSIEGREDRHITCVREETNYPHVT